ncbi:protein MEF2BNB-like protein [Caerostris extrusa]|uniref:Protein MEF2BNB-like protein n=1 Tax=Caerostris extrusa TaxID=172846 RepID=A0AAV4N307_CAEEX|nr:protein MEF2BNB-like protein [Caerostris extrusa]
MDSFHMPLSHSAGAPTPSSDPELDNKVKKEHIHKSLPQLVLRRIEVNQMYRELQGKCYDLEYAINAVKSMQKSHEHLQNINHHIWQAITAKQRLNNEEAKKTDKKKTSMYQRISGSFDLPASFLPAVATGLSSSASVSADLKSSPAQAIKATTSTSSPRRSRASSVSSVPSRAALTRQHSASLSPSKKSHNENKLL